MTDVSLQSLSLSLSLNPPSQPAVNEDGDENAHSVIKAKIASHPSYPKLLDTYIDCQKVGAPPEIACLLDEICRGNDVYKRGTVSSCFGADPDLDEFMETYCDVLVKYKSDLARPFDEASMFLNKIESQLSNLCKGYDCMADGRMRFRICKVYTSMCL